jgi:hypothetical protein
MATIKAGPKEQKLKEQREARTTPKLTRIKAKAIGKVASVKLSQRPK